ncbi:hypothetical protein PI124_g9911 [Phytophthora idaei]|nr:hypothetical protein PI125_g10567 [Phytophthora idaei]KAG3151581.1 hypothetical protein PI126_g10915 [Phytophthora idaei]KAG3245347.1 hypothetical protein PI124_g9911 [Phytophthora idaei]
MQSFLGSLNYYSRFVEDIAIYAAILYDLREADFHEMSREADKVTGDGKQTDSADDDGKWARAKEDFEILKNKIAASPVL